MGLTIDEAIKQAREVAETNRYKAKTYDDDFLKRFHTNTDKCKQCAEEHEQLVEWFEKLKAYEQAEEDGLLIRVPHPVGTEVYFAFKLQGVKKDHIRRWQYNNKGLMFYSHGSAYSVDSIGKTIFLTKAEAEQALAKMKGE